MAYLLMLPVVLALLVSFAYRRLSQRTFLKAMVGGLLVLNITMVLVVPTMLFAQENPAQNSTAAAAPQSPKPAAAYSLAEIGAGIAVGLAAIGAGIAVGITGAAAIGGMTEKPEILGRSLIFVGLAEGIAIYGLIISFMILYRRV